MFLILSLYVLSAYFTVPDYRFFTGYLNIEFKTGSWLATQQEGRGFKSTIWQGPFWMRGHPTHHWKRKLMGKMLKIYVDNLYQKQALWRKKKTMGVLHTTLYNNKKMLLGFLLLQFVDKETICCIHTLCCSPSHLSCHRARGKVHRGYISGLSQTFTLTSRTYLT